VSRRAAETEEQRVTWRSSATSAGASADPVAKTPQPERPAGEPRERARTFEAADVDDPAIARWWTWNYVRRDLTAFEARVLGDLAAMLDELAPPQVDPALCAIAADPDGALLVLVPHRSLGGLTLVLTVTERFVTISWTALTDLRRHDDLDLSREVYLHTRDTTEEALRHEAVIGVRDQLTRPIVLRVRSTSRQVPLSASCFLRGPDGHLRRIARLPPRAPWTRRFWRWGTTSDRDIRFTDRMPPPYSVPSRAAAWFRLYARRRRG
jgi:hypothetical protein